MLPAGAGAGISPKSPPPPVHGLYTTKYPLARALCGRGQPTGAGNGGSLPGCRREARLRARVPRRRVWRSTKSSPEGPGGIRSSGRPPEAAAFTCGAGRDRSRRARTVGADLFRLACPGAGKTGSFCPQPTGTTSRRPWSLPTVCPSQHAHPLSSHPGPRARSAAAGRSRPDSIGWPSGRRCSRTG